MAPNELAFFCQILLGVKTHSQWGKNTYRPLRRNCSNFNTTKVSLCTVKEWRERILVMK